MRNKILRIFGTAWLCAAIIAGMSAYNDSKNIENTSSETDIVTLGKYKGIEVEVEDIKVTDDEIQEQIDYFMDQTGSLYVSAEKVIEEGDNVLLDINVLDEAGSTSENDTDNFSIVVGSGRVPEFESAVIGLSKGDTAIATLSDGTVKYDYQLTVSDVQILSNELTDEYVAAIGSEDVKTVDELKESVKNYLYEEKERLMKEYVNEKTLQTVIDNSEIEDIPEDIYEEYKTEIIEQAENIASAQSTEENEKTADDVLLDAAASRGIEGTVDEYLDYIIPVSVKRALVIEKIAQKENIKFDEDELMSLLANDWLNHTEEYASLLDYKNSVDTDEYEYNLIQKNVIDFLGDNAVLVKASDAENMENNMES